MLKPATLPGTVTSNTTLLNMSSVTRKNVGDISSVKGNFSVFQENKGRELDMSVRAC